MSSGYFLRLTDYNFYHIGQPVMDIQHQEVYGNMDRSGESPEKHFFLKIDDGNPIKFEDIEDGQLIKIKTDCAMHPNNKIMYMSDRG